MFFPICSVDVFCFSLACFLLKVVEIFSCINFIDFTHCSQAFEGDAELTCAVGARQKKLSSRVSGNNGDPAFERPHWIEFFEKYTPGLWLPSTCEGLWLMTWSLRAWLRAARIHIYHLGLFQCLRNCGLQTTTAAHNVTACGGGAGGAVINLPGNMMLALFFWLQLMNSILKAKNTLNTSL